MRSNGVAKGRGLPADDEEIRRLLTIQRTDFSFAQVLTIGARCACVKVPQLYVVSAEVTARTLGEFVKFAQSRPGSISYGSAGIGSTAPEFVDFTRSEQARWSEVVLKTGIKPE